MSSSAIDTVTLKSKKSAETAEIMASYRVTVAFHYPDGRDRAYDYQIEGGDKTPEMLQRELQALLGEREPVALSSVRQVLSPTRAPESVVANAARNRSLREDLVATGAVTVQQLATGRGSTQKAARAWLGRAREAQKVFAVKHDGELLVPLFLLDERTLDLMPRWQPVLKVLAEQGDSDWAKWGWLATPSTWLDNQSPVQVFMNEPDRVLRAAQDRLAALL